MGFGAYIASQPHASRSASELSRIWSMRDMLS